MAVKKTVKKKVGRPKKVEAKKPVGRPKKVEEKPVVVVKPAKKKVVEEPKKETALANVHPDLKAKAEAFLAECKQLGLNVGVFQGLRTYEKQAELYAQGRTAPGPVVTKSPAGHSWHNFGLAIDVVFKDDKGWSWAELHNWDLLGKVGKKHGLMWGGDWVSFKDRPHFQLRTKIRLYDARRLYRKGGLTEVWNEAL